LNGIGASLPLTSFFKSFTFPSLSLSLSLSLWSETNTQREKGL